MNAEAPILSSRDRAAIKATLAALPFARVVAGHLKGVATLGTTSINPVGILLAWDPSTREVTSVRKSVAKSSGTSSPRDMVQGAVDNAFDPRDRNGGIELSKALEWFGVRGERPSGFALHFMEVFRTMNPDSALDPAFILSLIDERIAGDLALEARAAIDGEAVAALASASTFGKAAYAFYAASGERREVRLQAAAMYPLLARDMASKITTKAAIDCRKPLGIALETAFGADESGRPKLSKAVAKRLANVRLPDRGVPTEVIVDALSKISPDWFPKSPEDWEAFVDVADSFFRWIPPLIGEKPETLAAGCGGKWTDFRSRVAKAAASTRPPEDLDEAEREAWRPTIAEDAESLRAACIEIVDMATMFRDMVLLPAAAARAGDRDVYLSEDTRRQALEAAGRILFRGRALPAIIETARHWATQVEAIQEVVVTEETPAEREGLAKIPAGARKEVASDGWPPLCDILHAPNGVQVTPLTDPRELAEEGKRLSHCVGGYTRGCLEGNSHIVSFRVEKSDGSSTSLSTAEFSRLPPEGNTLPLRQHKGRSNGAPPPAAKAAFEWFVSEVAVGNIGLNRNGIMTYFSGKKPPSDEVAAQAGYDRKDQGIVEAALRAWDPYLTKRHRGMPLEGFCAVPEVEVIADILSPSFSPSPR